MLRATDDTWCAATHEAKRLLMVLHETQAKRLLMQLYETWLEHRCPCFEPCARPVASLKAMASMNVVMTAADEAQLLQWCRDELPCDLSYLHRMRTLLYQPNLYDACMIGDGRPCIGRRMCICHKLHHASVDASGQRNGLLVMMLDAPPYVVEDGQLWELKAQCAQWRQGMNSPLMLWHVALQHQHMVTDCLAFFRRSSELVLSTPHSRRGSRA